MDEFASNMLHLNILFNILYNDTGKVAAITPIMRLVDDKNIEQRREEETAAMRKVAL